MKKIAVLSGDLINSSTYKSEVLIDIVSILKNEFKRIKQRYPDETVGFSIFRGDSFQGVIENPMLALLLALQIKSAVKSYTEDKDLPKNTMPIADIRISIGIGEAIYNKDAIAESNGQAFQFSGRTLDTMKADKLKMALTTINDDINAEFRVHLKFLDATTDRWSVGSAEVVYYLLKGYKEQKIAQELSRSQAAINHRKRAAGWEEIKLLMEYYKKVAQNHFV